MPQLEGAPTRERIRPNVMFIHGPRNVGGDTTALLSFVAHLDLARINPILVATPDCEAWVRLSDIATGRQVRLIPLQMGVSDTEEGTPRLSAFAQASHIARALATLVKLLVMEHIDIVYTLDRSRSPVLAATAARLLGRPLVFHAHYPYYAPTHRGGGAVVRSADRIVAVSEFVRKAYLRLGLPAERIRTVHNGIKIDTYAVHDRENRSQSEDAENRDGLTVLLPGRLSRYKGQLELIDAMPAVLRSFPTTRFVFAGYDSPETGDLAAEGPTVLPILRRRAAELGVADHADFLGMTHDMASRYAAADVVVVPTWEEPFGLVVLEAMAAGRAIVASAAGGIPEIITSGETGLLVPPRDPNSLATAIGSLLANQELRTRLGNAARGDVAHRFTVERYCREFEDVLLTLADDRRSRAG